jgi:hypothetical protein
MEESPKITQEVASRLGTAVGPATDQVINGADDYGDSPGAVDGALQRPTLAPQLSAAQLRRWYWLRSELTDFARRMGVSTAGSKQQLTDRLAAALDGEPLPPVSPRRRTPTGQLEGALSVNTVIPIGQRCSQVLRTFFLEHIGTQFTFDAAMRSFIFDHAGSTLGDAVNHWHATRAKAPRPIDAQFELNRFTRQWYRDNPGGNRIELQRAWTAYRNTSTDQRPRA